MKDLSAFGSSSCSDSHLSSDFPFQAFTLKFLSSASSSLGLLHPWSIIPASHVLVLYIFSIFIQNPEWLNTHLGTIPPLSISRRLFPPPVSDIWGCLNWWWKISLSPFQQFFEECCNLVSRQVKLLETKHSFGIWFHCICMYLQNTISICYVTWLRLSWEFVLSTFLNNVLSNKG